MKKKYQNDEPINIDNLLVARRLAQFCPTSLSIDDLKSNNPSSFHMSSRTSSENMEESPQSSYIPPSPSVTIEKSPSVSIEAKSPFKLGVKPAKHRFGFLLADIKPIPQQSKVNLHKSMSTVIPVKMKYELPNVRKVDTPVKSVKPLMVVSLSSANLNKSENSPLQKNLTPNSPKSPISTIASENLK